MRIEWGRGLTRYLRKQSTSSSPESEISLISKSLNPWEETLKRATNDGNIPSIKKRDKIENCLALKIFLNQLGWDGHLKEFVDQKKTQAGEVEVKPNQRFDQGDDETNKTMEEEEDLPLDTIHMIGGPNYPDLKNRIRGEIWMIRQINEILLV